MYIKYNKIRRERTLQKLYVNLFKFASVKKKNLVSFNVCLHLNYEKIYF